MICSFEIFNSAGYPNDMFMSAIDWMCLGAFLASHNLKSSRIIVGSYALKLILNYHL